MRTNCILLIIKLIALGEQMDEKELSDIYHEVLTCLDSLLTKNDPLAVAGCMLAQSLGVYRTAMDDDEFDKLMLAIYERRNEVKPFSSNTRSLH